MMLYCRYISPGDRKLLLLGVVPAFPLLQILVDGEVLLLRKLRPAILCTYHKLLLANMFTKEAIVCVCVCVCVWGGGGRGGGGSNYYALSVTSTTVGIPLLGAQAATT